MQSKAFTLLCLVISASALSAKASGWILADSTTHSPLPNATIFDRYGKNAGMTRSDGSAPYISPHDYPLAVRYLGYKERTVASPDADSVFMQPNITELRDIVVESRPKKLLHMLAYVREYSTLSTYTDTVTLFREKMVDYMLSDDAKLRRKGWRLPRVLKSESYYHFTNLEGLDSVSDRCNNYFTWSDWVGMVPSTTLPAAIADKEHGTDTVRGKYSPTEIWVRDDSRVSLDVDVLADTASRKWVPNLSLFFRKDVDFERFKIRFNYNNVGDMAAASNLTGYSYNIESNGRGRNMFMFNNVDEPFFVNTYAEIYIVDKEYVTAKEAGKWDNLRVDDNQMSIFVPVEAPELQSNVLALIERVNNVDNAQVRVGMVPDQRLAGRKGERYSPGQAILGRLKGLFGIDNINARRKWNRQWKEFRQERKERNASR